MDDQIIFQICLSTHVMSKLFSVGTISLVVVTKVVFLM